MYQQACRFYTHLHFRQPNLYSLKIDNWFTELFAVLHIGHHLFKRTRCLTQCHSGIAATLKIKCFHQFFKPTCRNNNIFQRYFSVIQENVTGWNTAEAHKTFLLTERYARRIFFDKNGTNAFSARIIGQTAIYNIAIRMTAAGTPSF